VPPELSARPFAESSELVECVGADRNDRHSGRRVLGGLIGLSWLGQPAALPFIPALFPGPKIALLPLLILWFALGETSKVATSA
jgi:hypothetical protein